MKKCKRKKLEKKRRLERQRQRRKPVSQAYCGNKYRNEDSVPFLMQTEIGIYESFVITDRKITDHHVRRVLEGLIRDVRGGVDGNSSGLTSLDDSSAGDEEHLIAWSIRQHWDGYAQEAPLPGRGTIIGILQTILASVETWGNTSPTSRGYLRYLEGFMNDLGVHCRPLPPEIGESIFDADADYESFQDEDEEYEENVLLAAGRAWASGENSARVVFSSLAEEMIDNGEAEQVVQTVQQMLEADPPKHVRKKLQELLKMSLETQQRSPPPPTRVGRFLHWLVGK
ncbi:MAG: hypothetical protein JW959_02555 [Pirellulales bacterium]|nr:hypothetical protein [Pirellulales bacterium]